MNLKNILIPASSVCLLLVFNMAAAEHSTVPAVPATPAEPAENNGPGEPATPATPAIPATPAQPGGGHSDAGDGDEPNLADGSDGMDDAGEEVDTPQTSLISTVTITTESAIEAVTTLELNQIPTTTIAALDNAPVGEIVEIAAPLSSEIPFDTLSSALIVEDSLPLGENLPTLDALATIDGLSGQLPLETASNTLESLPVDGLSSVIADTPLINQENNSLSPLSDGIVGLNSDSDLSVDVQLGAMADSTNL